MRHDVLVCLVACMILSSSGVTLVHALTAARASACFTVSLKTCRQQPKRETLALTSAGQLSQQRQNIACGARLTQCSTSHLQTRKVQAP